MSGLPTSASQQATVRQAQTYWEQWAEDAFPQLDSRAYFLPPVYFNRVPMTRQLAAGQDVLVLHEASGQGGQTTAGQVRLPGQSAVPPPGAVQSPPVPHPKTVQECDVRDDAAMQRVLFCLQTMSEENKEVLVGLTQLQFGQYLGEPSYAAAAAQLPVANTLPSHFPKKLKKGDFDVLLIHQHYGFAVCEVKAIGDNIKQLKMSQQDLESNIRKKLEQAVSQLDKAEAMVSHLSSDVTVGLRVTKIIAVPNLTARQVEQAISGDQKLTQDLCRCLGTSDPADITGLCLCSDQLSNPKTPWDVSSDVLRELGNWWQRRVTVSGPDSHMTSKVYKTLVARFCGPATTVTVPCTSFPRLSVKTMGQAVSWTGECYTAQITLFPEQVDLVNSALPRVFLAGPPGTGKTVVLLLMGIEWLRRNKDVHVVSTWPNSRAVNTMLYHLLLHVVKTQLAGVATASQVHILTFDCRLNTKLEKAIDDLSQAAKEQSLYIIADEAGPVDNVNRKPYFKTFCDKLQSKVPDLHVWAASYFDSHAPASCKVEYLTRSLRTPPVVTREVTRGKEISTDRTVKTYRWRRVPDPTDGPKIARVAHRGHDGSVDCGTCGREVARILLELGVGVPAKATASTEPPCLQWRDVLVLFWRNLREESEMVAGMREAGIPVRVMKDEDIDDVATARSDVVWVALGDNVQGLERKVIVCMESDTNPSARFLHMSRCTSLLVNVSYHP